MGLNANELRIGNYVNYMDSEKTLTVSYHEIRYAQINSDNNYNPILLTEEWLIKFGFEKKSYFTKGVVIECVYYQLNNFVVYLLPTSFEVEIITKSGEQFNLFKNWKYMHELQNVYFIFENKELTHQKIN